MSDIKFSCPQCQQHIQAGPAYAGLQIDCPVCRTKLIVPGAPPAPAPTPAAAPVQRLATVRAHTSAPAQQPAAAASGSCPSCGAALARGAMLCTQCGYNISTGQRTVAGRPAPLGKPRDPDYQTPWYKTPYPYLGALFLLLGLLYFLGKDNPGMKTALVLVAALFYLGTQIVVIIAAFRESVGTGFLTLCIPFYGIYWVFKVNENDTLKILYTAALLIGLALKFVVD